MTETLHYTIGWDTGSWSHAWTCSQPGCHETGAGYESAREAEVVAQAHADTHVVAATRAGW